MDAADRGGLIVDRTQQPGREMTAIDDLLLPFTPKPGIDRIARAGDVLRIDVTTHSQGVKVAQPALAGTAQSVRQEIAVVVSEDHIGDDLRFVRVLFDVAA